MKHIEHIVLYTWRADRDAMSTAFAFAIEPYNQAGIPQQQQQHAQTRS